MKKKRTNWLAIILIVFVLGVVTSGSFFSNAKASTEPSQKTYKYYTSIQLEDGDTLWDIANVYITEEYESIDIYISEVKKINSLNDDTITSGLFITVPYYSSEYK